MKKTFLAAFFVCAWLEPAHALSVMPLNDEKTCQMQQVELEQLKQNIEKMRQEIELRDEEIRRLNMVIDNIRSQAGNDGPRPN